MGLNIFKKSTEKKEGLIFAPDEYTLFYIGGKFGWGKTAFMTWMLKKFEKDYDILYANYTIVSDKFKKIRDLTGDTLLNLNPDRMYNCALGIHEAFKDIDNRSSMSNKRKNLLEAIFQIRKSRIDIILDIPKLTYLDKRAVDSGNGFYYAHGKLENPKNTFVYSEQRPIDIGGGTYEFKPIRYFQIDMTDIFQYYDTFEKRKKRQVPLYNIYS